MSPFSSRPRRSVPAQNAVPRNNERQVTSSKLVLVYTLPNIKSSLLYLISAECPDSAMGREKRTLAFSTKAGYRDGEQTIDAIELTAP